MVKRYINISLPGELIKEIDQTVLMNSFGYKNRAELVKEAVRKYLRELDHSENLRKELNGHGHRKKSKKE